MPPCSPTAPRSATSCEPKRSSISTASPSPPSPRRVRRAVLRTQPASRSSAPGAPTPACRSSWPAADAAAILTAGTGPGGAPPVGTDQVTARDVTERRVIDPDATDQDATDRPVTDRAATGRAGTVPPDAGGPGHDRGAEGGGGAAGGRPARGGPARAGRERGGPGRSSRDRTRAVTPSTAHRNEVLATLRPEQIPVAEQLLRGGIPAVRQAIDEQNKRARAEGRAEVSPQPLLAMAEELLPAVSLAAWKDRAVAIAHRPARDAPLREVRSVVAAASTVSLDDEGRELVAALREALRPQGDGPAGGVAGQLAAALDEGRVADALRRRPDPPNPRPGFPPLWRSVWPTAAGAAMTAETERPSGSALLDAVLASPGPPHGASPAGLPTRADEELLTAARHAAGQSRSWPGCSGSPSRRHRARDARGAGRHS